MSWGVGYVGKVKDAKREIRKQFKQVLATMSPDFADERKVAVSAQKLIGLALRKCPQKGYVAVSAHGSQTNVWKDDKYTSLGQTVSIVVEPKTEKPE